jgi:hypothetical protein
MLLNKFVCEHGGHRLSAVKPPRCVCMARGLLYSGPKMLCCWIIVDRTIPRDDTLAFSEFGTSRSDNLPKSLGKHPTSKALAEIDGSSVQW